jgi:hypothetical protein
MQTKSLLKKGFVVGIIVLLGLNIVPTVGSFSVMHLIKQVKTTSLSGPRGGNFTINGTMGENGWYRSGVWITISFDPNYTAAVYYKIDHGNWTLYTGPFYMNEDGTHSLMFYFVDYEGNQSVTCGPFSFKIDQTAPIIGEEKATRVGLLKWKFMINVTDKTSGIDRVEFYILESLVSIAIVQPYDMIWSCNLITAIRLFIIRELMHQYWRGLQMIVYDNAGNSAMVGPT